MSNSNFPHFVDTSKVFTMYLADGIRYEEVTVFSKVASSCEHHSMSPLDMMMARFEDAPVCAVLLLLVCVSTTFAVNRQLHDSLAVMMRDARVTIHHTRCHS
ncbi:hypothetical protein B566_EDAN013001 [Ephemera danica]|nr:hypothetical protein B566_EDAN013001 [Ephemera danica]